MFCAGGLAMTGCEVDSYFDPSVTGYWEHTPTVVPILEHIAAIDDVPSDDIETSPPTRDDLLADAQAYRLGPSDELEVQVDNFSQAQRTDIIPLIVDQRGYVNFPRVGSIYVLGKTDAEVGDAVIRGIRDAQILSDPHVLVTVKAQRQQTFSVTGGVQNPSSYFIPRPDYRLLEALTAAGGMSEAAQTVYIIRQVPLSDAATGRTPPPGVTPGRLEQSAPPLKPGQLNDLLDDVLDGNDTKTPGGSSATPPPAGSPAPPGSPGVRRGSAARQPEGGSAVPARRKPEIDLIDSTEPDAPSRPMTPQPEAGVPASQPNGSSANAAKSGRSKIKWVFINGQWSKDVAPAPSPAPARTASGAPADPLASVNIAQDVMAQRVIEVPAQRLLAGHADVNVIIRPGDVIRVPVADFGLFYVQGAVQQPGVFNLPSNSKITIEQALISAGGLAGQAIPERLDLTRRIGKDRQATIRLNLRAIAERTQPDVYLKSNDVINVGTNFWAFPLAVARNGLRASYGFGFLLDRNFSGDVFGVDRSLR